MIINTVIKQGVIWEIKASGSNDNRLVGVDIAKLSLGAR